MRKISLFLIISIMLLSCVNVTAADMTITPIEHYPEHNFIVTNAIEERQAYQGDYIYTEYVIDTSSVITINDEVDALWIYAGNLVDIYSASETPEEYASFDSVSDLVYDANYCDIAYYRQQRVDNSNFLSTEPSTELINYLVAGTQIRFCAPGTYCLFTSAGFSSSEERLNYINSSDTASYLESVLCFVVEDTGVTNLPSLDNPYDEFVDEDVVNYTHYDDTMISIDDVVEYTLETFDMPDITYEDYVAHCKLPTTITCKKDMMNFVVEPIVKDAYGCDYPEIPLEIEGDSYMTEEGFFNAAAGATVTISTPGDYEVWAEDYDGNYTGIRVRIQDTEAYATDSKVLVDGVETKFESYNINDNNYFKLRDIAYILNGSPNQVNVIWNDADKRVELVTGATYASVGGEMNPGDGTNKVATSGAKSIYIDGNPMPVKAFMINDNNYFKLRDLGDIIGFVVDWDEATNSVVINTR